MNRRRALKLLAGGGVAGVVAKPALVSAKKYSVIVPIAADLRRRPDNESLLGRAVIRVARERSVLTLTTGTTEFDEFQCYVNSPFVGRSALRLAEPRTVPPGSKLPRLVTGGTCCHGWGPWTPPPFEPPLSVDVSDSQAHVFVDCEAAGWAEAQVRDQLAAAFAHEEDARWLRLVSWEQDRHNPEDHPLEGARRGLRAVLNTQDSYNLPTKCAAWLMPQQTFAWLAGLEDRDGNPAFTSLVSDPPKLCQAHALPATSAMPKRSIVRAVMSEVFVADGSWIRLEWHGSHPAGDIVRVTRQTGIMVRAQKALVGVQFSEQAMSQYRVTA